MKGNFSLNKFADRNATYIMFGNLRMDDAEFASIASTQEDFFTPSLIAHDVIEHSVAQRTNEFVTIEEELRAIGAAFFTRGIEPANDVSGLLNYIKRAIRVPMLKQRDHVPFSYEDFEECVSYCDDPDLISPAYYSLIKQNLDYGYENKSKQFCGTSFLGWEAFEFIRENVKGTVDELIHDLYAAGHSYYFDTEMKIFRYQRKLNNQGYY
jgi:hypothetical protein